MPIKTIQLKEIYTGYPEHLNNILFNIESDAYMRNMVSCVNNLPPVEVIDLGDCYSLSDGHHRLAVHIYLNRKEIRAEIL